MASWEEYKPGAREYSDLERAEALLKGVREFDRGIAAKGAQAQFAPLFASGAKALQGRVDPEEDATKSRREVRALVEAFRARKSKELETMRQALVATPAAGSRPEGPNFVPAHDLPKGIIPEDSMVPWAGLDLNKLPPDLRKRLLGGKKQ